MAFFVVVAVVILRLLPQHFAPLHKLFLLLVQEQCLHAGQEVLRAEAVLSAYKKRNRTKRKSKETESFRFRPGEHAVEIAHCRRLRCR